MLKHVPIQELIVRLNSISNQKQYHEKEHGDACNRAMGVFKLPFEAFWKPG